MGHVALLHESELEKSEYGRWCMVESWLVQIFMVDSLLRRWRARNTQQRNVTTPMATMNVVVEVRTMTSSRLLLMCPRSAPVAMSSPALLKSNQVDRWRNNRKESLVARRVQEFRIEATYLWQYFGSPKDAALWNDLAAREAPPMFQNL
jgi:hypothetical protein